MKQITRHKDKLVVTYDYDKDITGFLREVRGKEFKPSKKAWYITLSQVNLEAVQELIKKYRFEVSQDALELVETIRTLSTQQDLNLDLSAQLTGVVEVQGLKKELRPFQKVGVQFVARNKRVLIGDEMGLGKTIESIACVQYFQKFPIIIICPNSLKYNWLREFHEWVDLKVHLQLTEDKPVFEGFDVMICSYNTWLKWVDKLVEVDWQGVIVDESHYCKSPSIKRTKSILKLVKKRDLAYSILLSGTPVTNCPSELISQLDLLGVLDRDFGGWFYFVKQFCDAKKTNWGWDTSGASNLPELHQRLRKSCYIRRSKKDVLTELPDKQYQLIPVEISNRKVYESAENDFTSYLKQFWEEKISKLGEISSEDKENLVLDHISTAERARHLVQINYLKQLSLQGKLDEIIEWVESFLETGEKLVLFGIQLNIINLISEYFQCPKIIGEVKPEERERIVRQFQEDDLVKLLVLNLSIGSVGLTLTSASNVAFLELGWSSSEISQAEDRLHRMGQKNAVNVYYFLGRRTIDERIYQLIQEKKKIVSAVNEGIDYEQTSLYKDLINQFLNI